MTCQPPTTLGKTVTQRMRKGAPQADTQFEVMEIAPLSMRKALSQQKSEALQDGSRLGTSRESPDDPEKEHSSGIIQT